MDGVECARGIQQLAGPDFRTPTVMMLTAFSRDEVLRRLQAQRAEIAGVLTKPVTPSSLLDACGQALGLAQRTTTRAQRRKGNLMEHLSKLKGARILLVEDNAINREVAVDLLTMEGIIVEVALDGREALDKLAAERFDGVLMDCQMPVMDGFAATQALREIPELRGLPVIAMTANAMVGDRERALAAGMNDHIAKPIDIDEMFATLARWISPQPQAQQIKSAAPAGLDLHSLPGVDAAAALERLHGNEKVFRRTLLRFFQANEDFVASFAATWDPTDPAPARRLAHDLQSIAGLLCMAEVRRSALALEHACVDADEQAIHARLRELSAALKPVLQGLASCADRLVQA
jgi:CheY-like chemotaxis protein